MKERLKGLIIGVLIGTALTYGGVFAEYGENINLNELLEPIYVSFNTVKHILIKNVEKTPPDDMKPFVYNGRTYVALRYVSEAIGQNVAWDDKTGTVSIGGEVKSDVVKSYFNKLTDYDLLQKWDYFGSAWKIDGENGLMGKDNYDNILFPKINLPLYSKNYEIEVDFLASSGLRIYFAKHNSDDINNCDYVKLLSMRYSEGGGLWYTYGGLRINDKETNIDPDELNVSRTGSPFCHVKIVVKGDIAEVYLNDKYINANKVNGSIPTLGFGDGLYKNLKVTIND